MYSKETIEKTRKVVADNYTVIHVDGDYKHTCDACPSIYEFKDKDGNDYFFRYRNGFMSLTKNGERLYTDKVGEDCDGARNWNDFCIHALMNDVVILDIYTDKPSWIDSVEVDMMLEEESNK